MKASQSAERDTVKGMIKFWDMQEKESEKWRVKSEKLIIIALRSYYRPTKGWKNIGSASIGVARKRPKGQKETRYKETKETIGAW